MKTGILLGVYREQVFSPGKIEADAAVLDAALREMSALGWRVTAVRGEYLTASTARPAYVLSMAQSHRVLDLLDGWADRGTRIVNSVQSIRNCYRKALIQLLRESGLPIPESRIVPLEGAGETVSSLLPKRLWLKRGDVHAVQAGDVASVASSGELSAALDHFRSHEVRDVCIQEHVEGSVVKFYGVGQQEFFRAYLSDTGEEITPRAGRLALLAEEAARVLGLEVYGGDAVLTRGNEAVLIDMNDWPSFSRCFRPAGESIAAHLHGAVTRSSAWKSDNPQACFRA